MLLNEFFGKAETPKLDDKDKFEENQLQDDVFEYIINQDDLHKKYVMPIAKEIYASKSKERDPKVWLPLVNKGCLKFYKERNMSEDPNDVFDKELRRELCHRFAEHFHEDILKDEYKLG